MAEPIYYVVENTKGTVVFSAKTKAECEAWINGEPCYETLPVYTNWR